MPFGLRWVCVFASRNERAGLSPPSAVADVVTTYAVTSTFYQPDTQPNNSIFVGQYSFDLTTATVSGLSGRFSEAMTGSSSPYPNDTMNWLTLEHQLSAQPIEVGDAKGLLVTTFTRNNEHACERPGIWRH